MNGPSPENEQERLAAPDEHAVAGTPPGQSLESAEVGSLTGASALRPREAIRPLKTSEAQRDRFFQLSLDMKLAEEANRAKSELRANTSHEIRGPMNLGLSMLNLLLSKLLDDILDFSKIDAGKLEFPMEEFSLREATTCRDALRGWPILMAEPHAAGRKIPKRTPRLWEVRATGAAHREDPFTATRRPTGLELPRGRILLAEDNAINRVVAINLLLRLGQDVVIAENGLEVLRLLKGGRFDLVFMDVQMPELDGLDATRQIRQGEQAERKRLPIVALTANAMKGDRERCLEAGMDDYISKPFRESDLECALRKWLTR